MKPKIFFLAAALFISNLSTAQVLYTEDFESYNTGTFSTDLTGATQAQGGWYTLSDLFYPSDVASVNDYKIVADPNKGNVLQVVEENSSSNAGHFFVYRTDINTYWQQRTPGNNVLKLTFDLYTETTISEDPTEWLSVSLYNEKELLVSFTYKNNNNRMFFVATSSYRGKTDPATGNGPFGNHIDVPAYSWVTAELYIDYDNHQVYFSVPSLNHTVVWNTLFPLFLTGSGDHDDSPVKLEIRNRHGTVFYYDQPQGRKIDNINLSAQNTVPTVSNNEFVSDKFNLYPNPATSVVTISNSESIGIKELLVYDVAGKQIYTHSYKDEHQVQLNIEDLASGTYFLHIVTNEGTGIKKLIKK